MNKKIRRFTIRVACAVLLAKSVHAAGIPDPDGKAADVSLPVKVFIVMGQSNTLEMGGVSGGEGSLENAVKNGNLYAHLIDDEGNWTIRKDVRNVSVMQKRGKTDVYRNEWLAINGKKIGIEIGIGHQLGHAIDAPVMILKSSIGNRSLGFDLLPPGSERHTVDGVTYCGYKDHPTAEVLPYEGWKYPGKPVKWYAGKQYDDDTTNAKMVLENLSEYYPGATEYEIGGFFWWQGDKDRYKGGLAGRYEQNLVRLIKALRKDFDAPDAKFVCATLGQTKKGDEGNDGLILKAQLAVDGGAGKYSEFEGNVATVYSHPLSKGSSSNAHYGGHAETYMNVGEAMGEAMIQLLGK